MSIKESYLDLYRFLLNFLKFRLLSWSIRDFTSSKDVKLSCFSWSRVFPEKELGQTRCLASFITSRAERSEEVFWWNFRVLNSSILFKSRFWPIRSEKPNLRRNNSWRFIRINYFFVRYRMLDFIYRLIVKSVYLSKFWGAATWLQRVGYVKLE